MKEDTISLRNESYAVDFTPHDAVEKIVEEEKKQIIRAVIEKEKQAALKSVLKKAEIPLDGCVTRIGADDADIIISS